MKHRPITYAVLLVVFLLSLGFSLYFPAESVLREVSAIPGLIALVGALFQVFRDQAAFERQLLVQQQQQAFSLGATSHMANVAFDKHAEFCEKYVAEVHLTVSTLFREGPTQEALKHASQFGELRRQYAAWLPRNVIQGLKPFEAAIRKIGALSYLVEALRGTGDPERPNAIRSMYAVFREVMQITGELPVEQQPEVAVDVVIEQIRAVLGIEHLTTIRRKLIEQALVSVAHAG